MDSNNSNSNNSTSSYINKPANSWTLEDSIDWVNSLEIPETAKQSFIGGIKEYNIFGHGMVSCCEKQKSLLDLGLAGITSIAALGIVTAFIRHQQARNTADKKLIKETVTEVNASKSNSGTFSVYISNNRKIRKVGRLTSDHTVQDLIDIYKGLSGDTRVGLTGANGSLAAEKTLGDYGIKNEETLNVTFQVKGGTTDPNSNSNSSNNSGGRRKIDFKKYPKLKTMSTQKADCLFSYTRALGYDVISMSCGHAMESNSMFLYIKSKFENTNARIQMNCPMTNCSTIWDWQLCCHIAGMSHEEYLKYSITRNNRSREDIRECPHCQRINERKPGLAILRVACVCAKGDWCWVCARPWRGSGSMICCNKECSYMKNLNNALNGCGMSVPLGWKNVDGNALPDLRACPHCLSLMKKTGACKHMKCPKCEFYFCFSCLVLGDKKNYPKCKVGDIYSPKYTGVCQAAEKQQFQ